MKNKIRLVAADMDGTLLNGNREITEYTQEAIRKASEKGIYFVPATGRAVNALPKELKAMEEVRYGIFSNGATVYDLKENKILYKNHFKQEQIMELVELLRPYDLMMSISRNGQSYGKRKDIENIDYYELDENTREIVKGSRQLVDDLEAYIKEGSDTIEKMTLIFRTMEERAKVWEYLESIEWIQHSSSLPKNIEISKKGCNKGDGLLHLAQALHLTQEETMAFGDADNDREMLEQAGFSVAMENGQESMKKLADYVTVTNNEDGVAKAMEKFCDLNQ